MKSNGWIVVFNFGVDWRSVCDLFSMDVRIIHMQHAGYPISFGFIDYSYDSSLPVAKLADASMISYL